ncbi:hypothetical protein L7F22_024355, partial [Adiantum nelumboides]|nr:hypothetical protein [Adiantum nelumboides]
LNYAYYPFQEVIDSLADGPFQTEAADPRLFTSICSTHSCMQQLSHLVAEAVVHHRIIAAFSSQEMVLQLFSNLQDDSRRAATRQALLGGTGARQRAADDVLLVGPGLLHDVGHSQGWAAVGSVFATLDRISRINPEEPEAERVERVEGEIAMRHVDSVYPARPEVLVFRDFNLRVKAGQSLSSIWHTQPLDGIKGWGVWILKTFDWDR